MRYYYTDIANKTQGPVEAAELETLLRSHSIPPAAHVCAEGASEWQPIGNVVPTSGAAAATQVPFAVSATLASLCNRLLDLVRSGLGGTRLGSLMDFFARAGSLLLLVGAALTVVWVIVAAVRQNAAAPAGHGLFAIALLVVLHFSAQRFLAAGRELIANSRTSVNSTALMDCLALLLLVGAAGSLVFGLVSTIQSNSLALLIGSLVSSLALVALAAVCLSPSIVSVGVGKSTAGEEAMGVLSFFLKAFLFVVPFGYFVSGIFGCLLVTAAFFDSGSGTGSFYANSLLMMVSESLKVPLGTRVLLSGALAPIFAYFWFLLLYLPLDVIQAVVSLPGKIDRLRN